MLRASFRRLVATQFLTVCNDNLFKQCVLLLAVATEQRSGNLQPLAQALFSLPFLLFGAFAGDCADRFPKRSVILATKVAEVAVMLLAAVAFASGSLPFLLAVVFLMGAQSSFLGPAKYGALPEHAAPAELGRANGLFQATVLAGILLGTGLAGELKLRLDDRLWVFGLLLAGIATVGWALARGMARLPAADPDRHLRFAPARRFVAGLRRAAKVPHLLPAMLGHAVFWMAGSLLLIGWNELLGVRADGTSLGVDEGTWSQALAGLTLTMAIGALVAGRLAGGSVRRSGLMVGAFGMAAGFAAMGLVPERPLPLFACAATASFFSGFYVIPLRTLIQRLPASHHVGAALGTSQLLDFTLIFMGSLARPGLAGLGLGTQPMFLALGALMGASGLLLVRRLPRAVSLSADAPAR